MSVIDLSNERQKRDGPDADYVRRDDFGRPMYSYLISYSMDGDGWSTEIWAYSIEDAQRRVDAMRSSLVLDGQIYSAMLPKW